MKTIRLIASLCGVLCSWACSFGQSQFKNVDVAYFETFIKEKDVAVLDVRTAAEFEEFHIAGAVNIDVLDSDFLVKVQKVLSSDKKIGVYCRSGRRSANAAKILSAAGFKVVNLEGGIIGWRASGREVVK